MPERHHCTRHNLLHDGPDCPRCGAQAEWTITGMERHFLESDLPMCRGMNEIINATAIHGREVRHMADTIGRKLTPGEVAIAEKYGWRR